MPKICPNCGVDLDKKGHRNNCPVRLKKISPTINTGDGLTINPGILDDNTTSEVGGSAAAGGTPAADPPSDSGGGADFSGDSGAGGGSSDF